MQQITLPFLVPKVGLEPTCNEATNFKSVVYTDSTIWAYAGPPGLDPGTSKLTVWRSTN